MAVVGEGRFEHTATGRLGDKREPMLENPLLLRNELGKSQRRGYRGYPGDEERYGRPNGPGNGGAAGALSWAGAGSSSAQAGLNFPSQGGGGGDGGMPGRDFMALNRAAVQSGLVTAREQYQFRGTHDIRRKPAAPADKGDGAGGEGVRSSRRRLPPSMVFGISTRPSTPIHDLLEHRYQDRWLAERRSADMAHQEHSSLARGPAPPSRSGKVYETRASMLRIQQIPVEAGPLWKMPKFSRNAKASLCTFRAPGVQTAAYGHQRLDGINRQGNVGLGIYEPAQA